MSAQQSGDYLAAAALFLACPPDSVRGRAPAQFHAAWCFEKANQPADAVAQYSLVVEHTSEPTLTIEALYRLGWLALERQDMECASREFDSLVQLADSHGLVGPTVEHARYWHGLCLEREGRLVDAASRYESIIEGGNPELWHEAAYRRMVCLSQIGDLRGALTAADVLLQAEQPTCDPSRMQTLKALALEEKAQIARACEAA